MREEGEQRPPESGDIGDQNRFGVSLQLRPGKLLDEFLERADAPGKRDKCVGALEHQLLALMHVVNDDELLRRLQSMLLADKEGRDDAGDATAAVKRRMGETAHQPVFAAAEYKADSRERDSASERLGSLGKTRIGAFA